MLSLPAMLAAEFGEIQGIVWDDHDRDGQRDLGEPGLAGVTVFVDLNLNGLLDEGEPSAVTRSDDPATAGVDETGTYEIVGVPSGFRTVAQAAPAGYGQSFPTAVATGTGRLTFVEAVLDRQNGVLGLQQTGAVAISPDGNHVYAAGYGDRALAVFARNPATSQLTFVQLLDDNAILGGAAQPQDVTVSPDGRFVYVLQGNEMLVFSRDRLSGSLAHLQTLTNGADGVEGLFTARGVTVSPDGQHVYVTAYYGDSLAVFARDHATGLLSFVQVHRDGQAGVDGLLRADAVRVSPDGVHLYVTGQYDHSVSLFERNAATGELTYRTTVRDDVGGANGLNLVRDMTLSPDGKHVYVVAPGDHSVAAYERNLETGELTYLQMLVDSSSGIGGFYVPTAVVVSPDGRNVFVSASLDDTLSVFRRDPLTGLLAIDQEFVDGQGGVNGLDGAVDVAISPDGRTVIATSNGDSGLAVFSRDVGFSYTVPHHVQVPADGVAQPVDFGNRSMGPAVVSVARADANPTTAASVDFTVTFGEPVTGVGPADFAVLATGITGASVTGVSGSDAVYTVTVHTGSGDGTLRLVVLDDDSITAGGLALGGSGMGNGEYRYGQSYTFDRTPPSVVAVQRLDASPTAATRVAYRVRFSEDVSGVALADFTLTVAGLVGASVASWSPGTDGDYTVYVNTGSGDGTLRLDVLDDDSIVDEFGYPLGGAGAGNGEFRTGEVYQILRSGTVRGVKWSDRNGDGVRDAAEPGLAGWTIFVDANRNGQWDEGERSTVSGEDDPATPDVDETGWYELSGVPVGVAVIAEVGRAGWLQTLPELAEYDLERITREDVRESFRPAISADGRFVAFESVARLITADTNQSSDIYVYDRHTKTFERVNVSSAGGQAAGSSYEPSISADGRYVAFRSTAANLVAGDTNGTSDIFVHDRHTGQTRRVSVSSSGGQSSGPSYTPSLSDDGRFVAFQSNAGNLDPRDNNANPDIYIHDLLTGSTELVSISISGSGSGGSYRPVLSADGRYVTFHSTSANVVAGDTNAVADVFVRDRLQETTHRVSIASDGTEGNGPSTNGWISDDGRYVVFQSLASTFSPGDVDYAEVIFLHDRASGETRRISPQPEKWLVTRACTVPQISGDGRHVTYQSSPTFIPSQVPTVLLYDLASGETRTVSQPLDGSAPNRLSEAPAISGDGRWVAFATDATNLLPYDPPGWSGVFVADMAPASRYWSVYVNSGETVEGIDFGSQPPPAQIAGRYVFYNGSYFDGQDPMANPDDDAAIATDKAALLPGGVATFLNYTSYSRGLNGIMVDVQDLPDPDALSAEAFGFRAGNSGDPSHWPSAPAPGSITLRAGAGAGGADRVTLIWPDGALANLWLQVTVRAGPVTGLTEPDVFYFGNAIGESGNSAANAYVDGSDFAGARDNFRDASNRAPVDFRFDYNRDSFVDGADLGIARDNATNFLTGLRLINAPGTAPAAPAALLSGEAESVLMLAGTAIRPAETGSSPPQPLAAERVREEPSRHRRSPLPQAVGSLGRIPPRAGNLPPSAVDLVLTDLDLLEPILNDLNPP